MPYDYDEFYRKNPVNVHDDPVRFSKISEFVKGRVVDIGCGTGTLCDYFFGPYVGYDISEEAVKMAREVRRKDASFFGLDFSNVENFDFGRFDTIVMTEFLEHIHDDSKIFKCIKDTARRGTRVIISVPNSDRIPCDEHVRVFTIPELRAMFRSYGRVKFYNWAGAKSRIIMTIDIGEVNPNEVSLVIIAKNEEKGIEDCILSAIEFVDYVVVSVDDKTVDKTHRIAKLYADNLSMFTWRDDFSLARNEAQSCVSTPWILSLDAHELVVDVKNYEDMLQSDFDALLVQLRLESGFTYFYPRLYRKHCYFKDAVHNNLVAKNVKNYPEFIIQHNRDNGQTAESAKIREDQKTEMMPRILKQQLAVDKTNTRASFHLGLFYQSRQKYKLAIKYYKLYCKYSTIPAEMWYIQFCWAQCYLAQKKYFRAYIKAKSANRILPGRWEVNKLLGIIYTGAGNYKKALEYFVASLELDNRQHLYQPWVRDDASTFNFMGEVFFRTGGYKQAYECFLRASQICTDKVAKSFYQSRSNILLKIVNDQRSS